MKLKEISKDIYDVDAWLDESLGKEGTPEREKNRERAWEEYNAQILLDARKNAGLTQQELADALSVTRQTIISLENGRYNASLTLAHKAAQFFGITIEELFIFEDGENL